MRFVMNDNELRTIYVEINRGVLGELILVIPAYVKQKQILDTIPLYFRLARE